MQQQSLACVGLPSPQTLPEHDTCQHESQGKLRVFYVPEKTGVQKVFISLYSLFKSDPLIH